MESEWCKALVWFGKRLKMLGFQAYTKKLGIMQLPVYKRGGKSKERREKRKCEDSRKCGS